MPPRPCGTDRLDIEPAEVSTLRSRADVKERSALPKRQVMEYELTWFDPSLVIIRMSGVPRNEDFAAATREWLSSPKFRPGMDRINDLSALDATAMSARDIERIAIAGAEFGKMKSGQDELMGRLVMVTGDSPLMHGLSRMFEAYFRANIEAPFHYFKTLDEALAYLRPGEMRPAS